MGFLIPFNESLGLNPSCLQGDYYHQDGKDPVFMPKKAELKMSYLYGKTASVLLDIACWTEYSDRFVDQPKVNVTGVFMPFPNLFIMEFLDLKISKQVKLLKKYDYSNINSPNEKNITYARNFKDFSALVIFLSTVYDRSLPYYPDPKHVLTDLIRRALSKTETEEEKLKLIGICFQRVNEEGEFSYSKKIEDYIVV